MLRAVCVAALALQPKLAMLDRRIERYQEQLTWKNLTAAQRTYIAQAHAYSLYKRYRLLEECD